MRITENHFKITLFKTIDISVKIISSGCCRDFMDIFINARRFDNSLMKMKFWKGQSRLTKNHAFTKEAISFFETC